VGAEVKPHCSLSHSADQARKAGRNMLRAIRQLQRSAAACQACPLKTGCLQQAFNTEIDTLIAEINEEWAANGRG
jgi:hypothetical protein